MSADRVRQGGALHRLAERRADAAAEHLGRRQLEALPGVLAVVEPEVLLAEREGAGRPDLERRLLREDVAGEPADRDAQVGEPGRRQIERRQPVASRRCSTQRRRLALDRDWSARSRFSAPVLERLPISIFSISSLIQLLRSGSLRQPAAGRRCSAATIMRARVRRQLASTRRAVACTTADQAPCWSASRPSRSRRSPQTLPAELLHRSSTPRTRGQQHAVACQSTTLCSTKRMKSATGSDAGPLPRSVAGLVVERPARRAGPRFLRGAGERRRRGADLLRSAASSTLRDRPISPAARGARTSCGRGSR